MTDSSFEFGQPWVQMPPLAPEASAWLPCLTPRSRPPPADGLKYAASPSAPTPARLSATGTPCVVFGPGDIAQAHTKDEWIDLDQVAQAAEAYFRIAVELGS